MKCARPPAPQQQPFAARAYHLYGRRVGLRSAKHVFVPGDLDLSLRPLISKRGETCPDSRPTRMQNFTPLAFSAAEKSITVQTNKQQMTNTQKTKYPSILPYGWVISKSIYKAPFKQMFLKAPLMNRAVHVFRSQANCSRLMTSFRRCRGTLF